MQKKLVEPIRGTDHRNALGKEGSVVEEDLLLTTTWGGIA